MNKFVPVSTHNSYAHKCAQIMLFVLNIGWSIRIYILMTGRNVEQTKDVRMYIEEYLF